MESDYLRVCCSCCAQETVMVIIPGLQWSPVTVSVLPLMLQVPGREPLASRTEPEGTVYEPGRLPVAWHPPPDDWCCHGNGGSTDCCVGAPLQDSQPRCEGHVVFGCTPMF